MSSKTLHLQNTDGVFYLAEYFGLHAVENPWMKQLADNYGHLAKTIEHSGWKRSSGMTQTQQILKHINKAGSISQREAYLDYGIQSFHRRLTDLREEGYLIVGEEKFHPVTRQKYTRYSVTGIRGVK